MRYLNKIAFINSASVKYAEIELNGNVHFIGTQGVGKSTLLRAILFFYNANKNKLGISREKKRFDDYYFQYQNSYIVYEVVKNDIPFCVLAYKVNGKVAFRFINTEYKKEFFIDKNGLAFESWEKTKEALGHDIQYSKIISNYEEFRKIIYGDNKNLKPEFRKYALLESKQFQNIPRTIQNVLLNSNLEAKFIKDTIIKSINEEEFKIDISNYSTNHLKDFESQINDIKLWYKKNRKGQITIRNQADKIIEQLALINFVNRESRTLAQSLGLRMGYLIKEKPVMLSAFHSENNNLGKLIKEKENLKKTQLEREQKVVSEITYIKKKLSEAKRKLRVYTDQNISFIAEKVGQKDGLIQQKEGLIKEKDLLTSGFTEIRFKYEALLSQAKNQYQNLENSSQADIISHKSKFNDKKERVNFRFSESEDKLKSQKSIDLNREQQAQEKLILEHNKLSKLKAELRYKPFFNEEVLACDEKEKELTEKVAQAKLVIANANNEIVTLKKEWAFEEEQLKREFDFETDKKRNALKLLKVNENLIESKLKNSDSSLFSWLNKNVENWANSIGKVIDKDHILFNENLNPQLVNQKDTSFFGIALNLDSIEKNVKSIPDFKADFDLLKEEITAAQKEINEAVELKDSKLKKVTSKFGKKHQTLKDCLTENEYIVRQSEQNLIQNATLKQEWVSKAIEEKKNQEYSLQLQLDDIEVKKKEIKDNTEIIEQKFSKEFKKLQKNKNEEIELEQKEVEKRVLVINEGLIKNKLEFEKKIVKLESEKNSDLKNKGADTNEIQSIESKLKVLNEDLEFIKLNERLVFEYEKDKRELFDLVPNLKQERSVYKSKKQTIETEHFLELNALNESCKKQELQVKGLDEKIKKFDRDIEEFENFQKTEVYSLLCSNLKVEQDGTSDWNGESAINIISSLKDKYYSKQDKFKELQQTIHLFNGQFNDKNVFSFKLKLNKDEEYLNFASQLKEFIEENKIEEFKNRVNERFAHIIQVIGNETAELISKEAEIDKIIKKINDDFLSRNFVQAIKVMEMRTLKSSNPIVMLLIQIKEFNEEAGMSLGESNLFTVHDSNTKNSKAIDLLKRLMVELERQKQSYLSLSESFDLQFRIVENDNDSGWVEKLSNVGSEGTDVLVKAMINILLLNVFKNTASKRFKDFKLHCMMDEIGRLHPNNVRGILQFANDRNILLINGSPTSQNAMDYRYTYKLSKNQSKNNSKKYMTSVKRLVSVTSNALVF